MNAVSKLVISTAPSGTSLKDCVGSDGACARSEGTWVMLLVYGFMNLGCELVLGNVWVVAMYRSRLYVWWVFV